jgi:hypothetical protein
VTFQIQQSLIDLAKWHKDYVRQAPAVVNGQSPHAEEVMLLCLKHMEEFFRVKKSCMTRNMVAELARYLSTNLALRERYH